MARNLGPRVGKAGSYKPRRLGIARSVSFY
jgi:hypothetical protein